ncbi:hypothetical protein QOT17_016257 [Balamuthia mandrillaris]
MHAKSALVLLGLLLVAAFAPQQAHAGVNLDALLEGKLQLDGNLDAINTKLQAGFAATLGAPIEFSVALTDVSITIDTSAFEAGTITWEASVLTDEGLFEGSITASGISLGVEVVVDEEDTYTGSVTATFSFVATLAASFEGASPVFSFDGISVTVSDLVIDVDGLSSTITNFAAGTVTDFVEEALSSASDSLTEFGNSLLAVVNDGLHDIVGDLPRVSIEIDDELLDGPAAAVAAIVSLLSELDIGDFADGIFFANVNFDSGVVIDFWILDNEDGVSGLASPLLLPPFLCVFVS